MNHLLIQDEAKTREIYEQAMTLTDSNPLVLRSYGLFILAQCDAPLATTRQRALSMIKDARARDKDNLQFRTAYEIAFKYGCYKNPDSAMSYLYLGLAAYYVFENFEFAERALRRAVVMSPFDERVIENWKFLRDEFPDKAAMFQPKSRSQGMLATLKGGRPKNIHGRFNFNIFNLFSFTVSLPKYHPAISTGMYMRTPNGQDGLTIKLLKWKAMT